MKIPLPTFTYEQQLWNTGLQFIAGVDEVGRGAFAGPVVAAAVILPQRFRPPCLIHDSKLLTVKQREEAATIIQQQAICFSIAEISVAWINKIGVGKACHMAFRKAVRTLKYQPEHFLIDAFYIKNIAKRNQTPIVHGDQLSVSIAAASIVAKVYRDNLMKTLSKKFVSYNFAVNKGYGTKAHREALKSFGLSTIHRTSFALDRFLS